jgi:hypothetical protein
MAALMNSSISGRSHISLAYPRSQSSIEGILSNLLFEANLNKNHTRTSEERTSSDQFLSLFPFPFF